MAQDGSWGHLGAVLDHLGAILGPSWGHLGPSWVHLGPTWSRLGAILGHLAAILGDLTPDKRHMYENVQKPIGKQRFLNAEAPNQAPIPENLFGKRPGSMEEGGERSLEA